MASETMRNILNKKEITGVLSFTLGSGSVRPNQSPDLDPKEHALHLMIPSHQSKADPSFDLKVPSKYKRMYLSVPVLLEGTVNEI